MKLNDYVFPEDSLVYRGTVFVRLTKNGIYALRQVLTWSMAACDSAEARSTMLDAWRYLGDVADNLANNDIQNPVVVMFEEAN